MKNQSLWKVTFLSMLITLSIVNSRYGQQIEGYNVLSSIFTPNQITNIKSAQEISKNRSKPNQVIHNINKHLKKVAHFKAHEDSDIEIFSKFNLAKVNTGTGSISGVVYKIDGVTPIQDFCMITAFNEYGIYMGSDYTSEFKNGEYLIEGLSAGRYYVRTSTDKYADEYYNDVIDWQSAVLVDVVDNQETSGIDFRLVKYEGAISGKVTDEKGNPVEFCWIYAENEMGDYTNSGETDQSGIYIINGLQTGNYKIQAQYYMEDKNYTAEWYDNVYSSKEASLVSVVEPNTTGNINFTLEYGGAIKGKVLEPNGTSVYTYEAQIIAFDSKENYTSSVETNDMGEFLLTGLSPGNYKLQVKYNGMKNYVEANYDLESWYDSEIDFSKATPISVAMSDTVENIEIYLHEAGKIRGKVNDSNGQPVNYECEIIAYLEDKTQCSYGVQVENGTYLIDKISTGRYKLFANYFGHTQIVGEESASEWYDGEYNFDNAQSVEVNAPNTTENINFTLERGGYISGRVFNGSGQPLSYCGNVEAFNLNNEMIKMGDILNDGIYFITGLSSGKYKLRIKYSGEENYSDEWYNDANSFESATTVSVNAPNQTSNIDFTLESTQMSNGKFQGFITDEYGKCLTDEEHLIQVYCFEANSGELIDFGSNSFNGGFQLEAVGNKFKIAAVNCSVNWLPKNDSLAVVYYESGMSFNDPNTQTILLEANTNFTLNDIVLQKVSGSITGTLYYANTDQLILESYIIFVFDQYGYLAAVSSYNTMFTTPEGKYSANGLRPGNYYVLVMFGDMWNKPEAIWYGGSQSKINPTMFSPKITVPEEAIPVTVSEGETKGVDFDLPILSNIDILDDVKKLDDFVLSQNYPNPFNPSTKIKFGLPKESNVSLVVYNNLGQEVTRLVNQQLNAGYHEVEFNNSSYSSSIYFYRLQAGNFSQTKKMILLK